MKKLILGIALLNQLVSGMDLPTSPGEKEQRSNLRETTVAQLSINDLQDMIRDSVKMAVIANTQEFREAVNEVSSQLKEALNQRINFQAMNFQTVLERKEEEHKREKEILEAKLAEKEKSSELRGILLKINVNDRTPISDKAESIQQLEVLERHDRTESIYKRCLAFNELIGRTDLGVSATQEDLDAIFNYINDTKVQFQIIPSFQEKGGANWWKEPNVDWDEYNRIINLVPEARQPHVYENYGRASFGTGRPHHSQSRDWPARDRFISTGNEGISKINQNRKNAEIARASSVPFPAEEFNRLIDQVNRFFTEGLQDNH